VTVKAGIGHPAYGLGACAADDDNDGNVDLFITNAGPGPLYHNNGNGTFADVTRSAGAGASSLSTSCAFADIDNDGDVDLFVASYVDLQMERPYGDTRVRAYCRPELCKACRASCIATTATAPSPTSRMKRVATRRPGKASASCAAITTMMGGSMSSSRTISRRTFSSTTRATASFARSGCST
jgi:hypothetical protein